MALQQKITEDELYLLAVLEDPIWLGEFLRNTANGEIDTSLWPKQEFKYRWYQKDFLSDENEFIVLTGGRAIGKCHPSSTRILTIEGYKRIADVLREPYITVYTLSKDGSLEQKRAVITNNGKKPTYKLITESGYEIVATENHPFLTTEGYKLLSLLKEGDYIAVATRLPYESIKNAFSWHELRWLGYTIFNPIFRPITPLKPRTKKQAKEIEYIADCFHINWHKNEHGEYSLIRPLGPFRHPVHHLLGQCKLQTAADKGLKRIPPAIMTERIDNTRVFLEALFTQFGTLSAKKISISVPTYKVGLDVQELLLRFGIESRIDRDVSSYTLSLLNYRAVYRFYKEFTLPGIAINTESLPLPETSFDVSSHMRYERIVSIHQDAEMTSTYAVHVYDNENYVAENMYVHNSIVLEDKIVHEVVNFDQEFPVTTEETLVTPNQNQMTPILDRLIQRFTSSPLLKSYLNNEVNRSKGTLDFTLGSRKHRLNARIAGSRGENNMVGLHTPRIRGDEMQLFPITAFTQLEPTYNSWEPRRQQIHCGVPNGFRNSVLYQLDKRSTRYKKYKIPSHNNPFYTSEDDLENLKKYNGEEDDRYQQLVLGRHGTAAFQVIPRESIITEPYDFSIFKYTSGDKLKGIQFRDVFLEVPLHNAEFVIFAIDTGYVDPTIIQVLYMYRGIWRIRARYRLQRIDFSEQEQIIDYLDSYFNPAQISIDIGAGGNGAGIMHNLTNRPEYASKKYVNKIVPILFNENIVAGFDTEGNELIQDSKSYAGAELSRMVQSKELIFSEIDHEGISQVERIAKQKNISGKDRYFVLSDKGSGASEDDHIFASFVCFILGIRTPIINTLQRKIGLPKGLYS